MRGPATVGVAVADGSQALPCGNRLTDAQAGQRLQAQVPVEGEESLPVARLVLQEDDRAVILGSAIVGGRVDDTGKRSVHRSAGRSEQVQSKVNGSAFVEKVRTDREMRRGVEESRLIVTSDADGDPGIAHRLGQTRRQQRGSVLAFVSTDQWTANAQVDDKAGGSAKVHVEERRRLPFLAKPADDQS